MLAYISPVSRYTYPWQNIASKISVIFDINGIKHPRMLMLSTNANHCERKVFIAFKLIFAMIYFTP